ncbi:amidohydrolase family protein [Pengzhenrongella sicca]|uniref:amidohydrolase family protein n=1 Tax=Pengzhenrongella sicca TaxID=2819238 RepID=UPI001D0C2CFA|nr:amidohydrolase family protein [Pengzhenrongella sicca]
MTRALLDAHLHTWHRATNPQPWIDPTTMAAIDRDFSMAQAGEVIAAHGGVGGVVVQAINSHRETIDLLAAASARDGLAVVGWVDLTGDVAAQVDALRGAPGGDALVGIRHLVHLEPDDAWLLRADVARGLEALASAGLPFDLVVRPWQLRAAAQVARAHPGVLLVLEHLGKPPITSPELVRWTTELQALAGHDNVVAKVSGLTLEDDWGSWTAERLRPVLDHALETFGPDRLMFGSDWPLVELTGGYGPWKDAYLSLTGDLSPAEQAALDSGTARRAYSL